MRRLGHRPGKRDRRQGRTGLGGDLIERREHPKSLAFEIGQTALAAHAFAEIVLATVLAGEEAVGEAVEGEDAEPWRRATSRSVALEALALDQIVPGLQRAPASNPEPRCERRIASSSRSAVKLDRPIARIFPSSRSRSKAPRLSASGASRRPCAGNRGRSARSRAAAATRRTLAITWGQVVAYSPATIRREQPTLVAMTTLSRFAGSRFSQRPITASLSPPSWPGTQAE